MSLKEAMFYKELADKKVRCYLCPHNCYIAPGQLGICRVRKNIDGKLYSLNYGKLSSIAMDPIEKKPLYHFYPGSMILSVGSFGCNFRCKFCQNWQIAQETNVYTRNIEPSYLVDIALDQKDNIGIAYTYNEPVIWYEYVYECAKLAKGRGLKNVLITNGYIQEESLDRLLPHIDAMNIDLKAFDEDFYKSLTTGSLLPVKRTIEKAAAYCHVEVTTLLIPGLNDDYSKIASLSKWLSSIRKDIPLHLTRYYPNYKLNIPPTPITTIKKARKISMKYLDYVFTGNIIDSEGSTTFCVQCKSPLIVRSGFHIENRIVENKCKRCQRDISKEIVL